MRTRSAVVGVGVVAAALVGAGLLSSRSGGAPQADRPAASAAPSAPAAPAAAAECGGPSDADDPLSEGWTSEARSTHISAQLSALGKLIEQGRTDAASLAPLCTDDYQGGEIAPTSTATVFEDRTHTVLRGAPSATSALRGPAALAASLGSAIAAVRGAGVVKSKFKIVAVHEHGDETGIELRFTAFRTSADGAASLHGEWETRWRGTPARLVSMTSGPVEIVRSRGALYRDATALLLGEGGEARREILTSEDELVRELPEMGASDGLRGVSLGDADGDGLDDVVVASPAGLPLRLLLARGDGSFVDGTAQSGLGWNLGTSSTLLADLDNDGDEDLAAATAAGFAVAENLGRGSFALKSVDATDGFTTSLAAADVDADGDLDVYVCVYRTDGSDGQEGGSAVARPVRVVHDSNEGARNHLFRNEGGLRFTDVTAELGLDVNNCRLSLAASFADYDDDGDPDLYVANDFGRDNLYRNDGGRFTDVAAEIGAVSSGFGMGVTWGDADGDGRLDAYVSNMFSSAGRRITTQERFKPATDPAIRRRFQELARGNSLLRNRGDGKFDECAAATGTEVGLWAWGSIFTDADGDGREDLFVPNGYISRPDTRDL